MFWLRVKRQRCFSPLNWTALCQDPNSGIGKLFRCQLLIYWLSALTQCLVCELLCPLFAGCNRTIGVPPQHIWLHYSCHYDILSKLYYQLQRKQWTRFSAFCNSKLTSKPLPHTNIDKQCWDYYLKWDVKADTTIYLNWLWAEVSCTTPLYYRLKTCCQLVSRLISVCRQQDSELLWYWRTVLVFTPR